MSKTKSAELVLHAEQSRPVRMEKSFESHVSLLDSTASDSLSLEVEYRHWEKALQEVNDHITVREEEIKAAKEAYQEVGELLAANLAWPPEAVSIVPQGSVSTRTLIRSPIGGEKFDIDAVCQVDISRVEASEPMVFFEKIGKALVDLNAEARRRCWNIPFPQKPFYLEFTPSVPLITVPERTYESMAPRYRAIRYKETALAVVDTPTASWKTSNPMGMSTWVNDTARRVLILVPAMESLAKSEVLDRVAPVLDQTVEITDTLRVAIRLFKRHRDMCVGRGLFERATQPISVIIVTLLTSCYEGFADLGRFFRHPVEVLAALADFMPRLVLRLDGKYRVDNPTVEGENFAEKWNDDDGERFRSFTTWCDALTADLQTILALSEPQAISNRVREVFGTPAPTGGDGGLPTIKPPKPKATPVTTGLA